jgi:hypothetical protein
MVRIFPALLGIGLAALWTVGMSVDATTWMIWVDGAAALFLFASVGVIPDRRSSGWAAFCLGAIAAGLFGCWAIGFGSGATAFLTWWTFVAACLTALTAVAAGLQGAIDALRTRDGI